MFTYLGDDMLAQLCAYCAEQHLSRFRLVADPHTYAALGQKVEQALRGQGGDVQLIVLNSEALVAVKAKKRDVDYSYGVAITSSVYPTRSRISSRCASRAVPISWECGPIISPTATAWTPKDTSPGRA